MGKIDKYANIYDKDGNLLRHVGEDGKLKNYTTEELEQLVDKLAEDKDENGFVKDPQSLNNVHSVLFQQYQKHGISQSLLQKLQELQKNKSDGLSIANKTSEEEIERSLLDVSGEIIQPSIIDCSPVEERKSDYEPERYIDFEEIAA